jgi:hypothetical protein
MTDADSFMEEVMSSKPMDTQAEDAVINTSLVPLRTLMDIDAVVMPHMPPPETPPFTITRDASKEQVR